MGMLDGKRALIFGVASKRSIAWGIAQAMHREGADLAFTYQNERLRDRGGRHGRRVRFDARAAVRLSPATSRSTP